MTDFIWLDGIPDMHKRRRAHLLRRDAHKLLAASRWDVATAAAALTILALHLTVAYCATKWIASPLVFVLCAYVLGGTFTHSLFLAIHEVLHGLALPGGAIPNNVLAMVLNTGIPVPYAMSFQRYHALHHRSITVDGDDTDLPTAFEARLLSNPFGKLIFCCFQGLFYGIRPLLVHPLAPTAIEYINVGIVFSANLLFWHYDMLGYFVLSALFGTGLHPMAAHFISEHYILGNDKTETFSRYPTNPDSWQERLWAWLTFGVDYHVEHHDFSHIPWRQLPALHRAFSTSQLSQGNQQPVTQRPHSKISVWLDWLVVYHKFICDPAQQASLFDRIKRAPNQRPSACRTPPIAANHKPISHAPKQLTNAVGPAPTVRFIKLPPDCTSSASCLHERARDRSIGRALTCTGPTPT